jgi:cytochrome bd-type quinol oxidase subunit 2
VGPPRFITGVVAALSAGLLFGSSFNASYYIMDHASSSFPSSPYSEYQDLEMLDFVFAHFNGIFLTSSTYLLLALLLHYLSSYQENAAVRKPFELYPATLLPAFASGLLWAIAMVAWFVANQKLTSLSVTFPIITSTPGLVASLWGVLVFGEIKGKRNLLTLAGGGGLTVTSCLLIAFSK